jgi:hypothetical protein
MVYGQPLPVERKEERKNERVREETRKIGSL